MRLAPFLQEKVKGALVKSGFLQLKDMDLFLLEPGENSSIEETDDLIDHCPKGDEKTCHGSLREPL